MNWQRKQIWVLSSEGRAGYADARIERLYNEVFQLRITFNQQPVMNEAFYSFELNELKAYAETVLAALCGPADRDDVDN